MTLNPMALDFVELAQTRLPERLKLWVPQLAGASLMTGVCPWLLAAVMDRESLGGEALRPRGAGGTGDGGHGHGLMQVDDRSHGSFLMAAFNGDDAQPLWKRAAFNVLYGAELLAVNLRLFEGDSRAALAAYNAGPGRVRKALRLLPPTATTDERTRALDRLTAGGDYVSNVLRRRADFLAVSPRAASSAA